MLTSCDGFKSTPTISSTDVMETAMSTVKTAVVETQIAAPTITPSPQLLILLMPTPIPPTQTPYFPVPFDSHDPEAVLRTYFDAWNRNDSNACQSLGGRCGEPVEFVHILEIKLTSSSQTECVYSILFDIKVKGQGGSMHNGHYLWNYYLTWDTNRDTWYISNYGFG